MSNILFTLIWHNLIEEVGDKLKKLIIFLFLQSFSPDAFSNSQMCIQPDGITHSQRHHLRREPWKRKYCIVITVSACVTFFQTARLNAHNYYVYNFFKKHPHDHQDVQRFHDPTRCLIVTKTIAEWLCRPLYWYLVFALFLSLERERELL